MARIAEERLNAVRRYLHQVFPDWALAERWDDDREAHTFLLKKPSEPVHLLKVSRSVLTADATYSKAKDEMVLYSIDPTNSSVVTVLPDTNTKVTTLKLSAKYALQRNSAIRLTYVHDEYKTDDWTWANRNYSPAEGDTTVLQNPNQKVDFVGLSYLYRF